MAISLIFMVGRIGCIFGSNIIPFIILNYCTTLLSVNFMLLIVCVAVGWCMLRNKPKPDDTIFNTKL